jgi:hypothetical protein
MYEEQFALELASIRRYQELALPRPYYEVYRTHMDASPAATEIMKGVEADIEARAADESRFSVTLLERMKAGAPYTGSYSITRAGTADEKRRWSVTSDNTGSCLKVYGKK